MLFRKLIEMNDSWLFLKVVGDDGGDYDVLRKKFWCLGLSVESCFGELLV